MSDELSADRPAVVDQVIADLLERKAEGMRRYGVPLVAHNGYEARKEAYAELLDFLVYSRQHLTEDDDYKAMYEVLQAQLQEAELDRDAALTELGKAEENRALWRTRTEEQDARGQRLLGRYDRLTLALSYLWGDARKAAFVGRVETSGPFVFEDVKASKLARKNLDVILDGLADWANDDSGSAADTHTVPTVATPVSSSGVTDPGVVDGDLLASVLADATPQEWRMDAAREFAETVLAEMHRVGYTVLRGSQSKPWTPREEAA